MCVHRFGGTVDHPAAWLSHAPKSIFVPIDASIQHGRGMPVANLHQGKTYFAPCVELSGWQSAQFPFLAHEHAPPGGISCLCESISVYLKNRHKMVVDPADIVITNGATHGIFTVLNTILEPGDEVLLLSPQWLFATGLVAAARGHAVAVPVFLELAVDPSYNIVSTIEMAVTTRTRAVYLNTPNNPTGVTLSPQALDGLIEMAHRRGLWLVADNAYENFDFTKVGFIDIATLGGGRERTYSVYTLSKTFAMPGYRIGYVVVPPGRASDLIVAGLYSTYSVTTTSQWAALTALTTSPSELDRRRLLAAAAWRLTDGLLEVPHTSVAGGLYTLLDLTECAVRPERFLQSCLDAGVSLSPGAAFGSAADQHARLCFTAVEPSTLRLAIEIINEVYRRSC